MRKILSACRGPRLCAAYPDPGSGFDGFRGRADHRRRHRARVGGTGRTGRWCSPPRLPDTPNGRRHLVPALADAGLPGGRPFLRAHAPIAVPSTPDYATGALTADAIALHDALGGHDDSVVIGHDRGAMATSGASAHAPERWRGVVTTAVPRLAAMGSASSDDDQITRSSYRFFFRMPLGDMAVPSDDFAFVAGLCRDWSPSYDAAANAGIAHVADALGDPAHLSAAIGCYRSTFATPTEQFTAEQAACTAPTPHLHRRDDGCLGVDLVHGVEQFPGAGHFLRVDSAADVDKRVIQWVTAS